MAFRLERVDLGGTVVVVITMAGANDVPDVAAAERAMDRLLDAGAVRFVADLEAMDLVTSRTLGLLLLTTTRARAAGGDLVLCRPSKLTRSVIDRLGLGSRFRVVDSVAEGVARFERELPPPDARAMRFTLDPALGGWPHAGRLERCGASDLVARCEAPPPTVPAPPALNSANIAAALSKGRGVRVELRADDPVAGEPMRLPGTIESASCVTTGDGHVAATFGVRLALAPGDADAERYRRWLDRAGPEDTPGP